MLVNIVLWLSPFPVCLGMTIPSGFGGLCKTSIGINNHVSPRGIWSKKHTPMFKYRYLLLYYVVIIYFFPISPLCKMGVIAHEVFTSQRLHIVVVPNGTLVICVSPNNGWIGISVGRHAFDWTRCTILTTICFKRDTSSRFSWQSSEREKRNWSAKVKTHRDRP